MAGPRSGRMGAWLQRSALRPGWSPRSLLPLTPAAPATSGSLALALSLSLPPPLAPSPPRHCSILRLQLQPPPAPVRPPQPPPQPAPWPAPCPVGALAAGFCKPWQVPARAIVQPRLLLGPVASSVFPSRTRARQGRRARPGRSGRSDSVPLWDCSADPQGGDLAGGRRGSAVGGVLGARAPCPSGRRGARPDFTAAGWLPGCGCGPRSR